MWLQAVALVAKWVKEVWYYEAEKICNSEITVSEIEEEDVYTTKGRQLDQLTGSFSCN